MTITTQAGLPGLTLRTVDADGLAGVRDALPPLDGQALIDAASASGFALVVAERDGTVVGCAATSRRGAGIVLDPVALRAGLPRTEVDALGHALVAEALRAHEAPWLDVAVRPGSVAVNELQRRGWRPLKSPHDSPYVLLGGADAEL